jgi:hypothetical protein
VRQVRLDELFSNLKRSVHDQPCVYAVTTKTCLSVFVERLADENLLATVFAVTSHVVPQIPPP